MQLYTGVVENRMDPLKLGRCQVRVVGIHNHDKAELPTKDLPWAYPMQPLTSAAMSGIGFSPVGPVEGTWVVVSFRDSPENQHPVIMGTLGGIPHDIRNVDLDNKDLILTDSSGNSNQNITSNDGELIKTGVVSEENTSTEATFTGARNIRDYPKISDEGINLIIQFEPLRLTAVKENGVWVVGYGTTKIDGIPVEPNRRISLADAEEHLRNNINNDYYPEIKNSVKPLVTQCMVDAILSFCHSRRGTSDFLSSSMLKELNSERYKNAASEFNNWVYSNGLSGTEVTSLSIRRTNEKNLFLSCGIPDNSGNLEPITSGNTPVGDTFVDGNGNTVVSDGLTSNTRTAEIGFRDPASKYPLYKNEADTNRLARHENIDKTIVFKKDSARDKKVSIANSTTTWDQSKNPYNAKYPYNHVYQSESGHVMEFDDTKDSERVHLYHKAGTFFEIDANGTKVTRIVGDNYEILERNGYIHIMGSENVTIEGAQKVKVKNTLDLEVDGATTINIHNNATVNITGNTKMAVGGEFALKANSIKMESETTFDVKSGSDMKINSASGMYLLASGNFAADYARGDFGTGSQAASSSGLSNSKTVKSPVLPSFNELTLVDRTTESGQVFESPDEGDSDIYRARQLEVGTLDSEELDTGTEEDSTTPAQNSAEEKEQRCSIIFATENFEPSLQLSKYFTLADLTSGGSRRPRAQSGRNANGTTWSFSKQEIVCNLKGLAENCLDPIKEKYPNMMITSGFRRPWDTSPESYNSQHNRGQAADIVFSGQGRKGHYNIVQDIQQMVPYDQLILEYKSSGSVWIHISYSYEGNRNMSFTYLDHLQYAESVKTGKFHLVT